MRSVIIIFCACACIAVAHDTVDEMQGAMDPMFKNQIMELFLKLEETQAGLNEVKEELQQNKDDNSQLKKELQQNKDDNSQLKKELQSMKESAAATVIFNAYGHQTQTDKGYIVFEDVSINIGDAYNPYSGLFTAPVKGVYHFTANLLKYESSQTYVQLKKNDQILATTITFEDVKYDTLTATVIVQLEKGDIVGTFLERGGILGEAFDPDGRQVFFGTLLSVTI